MSGLTGLPVVGFYILGFNRTTTMHWRIEVKDKEGFFSCLAQGLKKDIEELGVSGVQDVRFRQVFLLAGSLTKPEVVRIAEELLIDRVIQEYELFSEDQTPQIPSGYNQLEIRYKPGVMDPVEESVLKAISDLGISSVSAVRTAKKYLVRGIDSRETLLEAAQKLFYNKIIQDVVSEEARCGCDFSKAGDYLFELKTVALLEAGDEMLLSISRDRGLSLDLAEMRQIQAHFRKQRRDPTDCELETIAQTWSEHCLHKTFRGVINYKERLGRYSRAERFLKKIGRRRIQNLLKSTIMKATLRLKKPYCVSVFEDNSGIIKFDDKFNVCFKVETHNHPSALEPYGGANTGLGGVIRDIMGTGLGAKPIVNTDVFCFGSLDMPASMIAPGSLSPRRVMKGVVSGVRDYGNRMGIPTANGAVLFDRRFAANPLVYCGSVGILPKSKSFKRTRPGEVIVVAGGRTGRDGIHGATFSSVELNGDSCAVSSGAVQIGNAITEKKLLDALLLARDAGLYTAVTDCGAGGLSSAVGEMARDLGCRVDLEKVPLKYHGLSYGEIWISEAQERMVFSVKKEKAAEFVEVCAAQNVEAVVIGEFTHTKELKLYYRGRQVARLDMDFLYAGWPKTVKEAFWSRPESKERRTRPKKDLTGMLKRLLAHPNIASKEWVIRQYDHEVQARTLVKPLTGSANDGPADACVVAPRFDSPKGLAVSCGINFKYGELDPYWMAAGCVDEALRQIICVGGSLKQAALLDNFCWGNPDKPDRLGGLVRCAFGCHDAALGFGVPFISGKDSLYNEFGSGSKTSAIPGTLLVSAIAVMDEAAAALTMDLKKTGNLLYVLGETFQELGGSHYYELLGAGGGCVPKVDFKKSRRLMERLSQAAGGGLICSAHDCSEGGLAVALAEMSFAGGLGANIFLQEVPYHGRQKRQDFILFSESHSRFIVEVERQNQAAFEKTMRDSVFGLAGCVTDSREVNVFGLEGDLCVQAPWEALKVAWQETLRSV